MTAAAAERHCAVIGAGIAGVSAAYALARRGWRVTLIERQAATAQEASGNAAGVLMPLPVPRHSPRQRWFNAGFHYTLQCLEELAEAVEWSPCGVFVAAWNERARRRQQDVDARWRLAERPFVMLDQEAAAERCGLPVHCGGLYFPSGGWVNPPSFCRALLAAARSRTQVLYYSEVITLAREHDIWRLLDHSGNELAKAPVVIIAAGKDATGFAQTQALSLIPVRGQVTEFAVTEPSRRLCTVVCGPGFALPAINGRHWIGATFDSSDSNPAVTYEGHRQNREILRMFLPALADALETDPLSGRVAFRMATPDYSPVVGSVPNTEGLYISAGHSARGLVSAPLAAELLAAMIQQEDFPVADDIVQALQPARFAGSYVDV